MMQEPLCKLSCIKLEIAQDQLKQRHYRSVVNLDESEKIESNSVNERKF